MRRPLAIRITVILLGLLALLPLGVAGVMAVAMAGDLNGAQDFRLVGVAALLAVWPFLTAVGITGYRRWALFSLLTLATALSALAAICLRCDLNAAAGSPGQGHPPLEFAYVALLALGVVAGLLQPPDHPGALHLGSDGRAVSPQHL